MEVNTTPGGGMSVDVDIDKPTVVPAPSTPPPDHSKAFLERLPQEYAQKEWASNFAKTTDPWAELAKAFDSQQALIGRKAEGLRVPGEGATPDDWTNFHKAIGVPETPDKYEYKMPDVQDERLKPFVAQDEGLLNKMREAAMKAGVRIEGFQHLAQAWDEYYLSELDQAVTKRDEMMAKLESGFKAKFGDRSGQVLEGWQKSMVGLLGKEQAMIMDALDPTIKVVLAEYHDAFSKKYIREDNLNLDVPSSSPAMTQTQYSDEFEKLFRKQQAAAPGSPEFFEAKKALQALREKGATIFK